jgi:hypothetical protein
MKAVIVTLAAALTCFAPGLPAAEPAQDSPAFIFATYFHCSAGTVERADESVAKRYKDDLDKMVKSGTVSSWGWLGKVAGGEWTRVGYVTAASLQAVLTAADKSGNVMSDGHPPGPPTMERKAFDEACGSAENYVWRVLTGSDPRGHRGPVGFSTYYVCDQSREEQADALVKRIIGARYNELVGQGKLSTWLWAEHIVGGKYRRLATMTAPSRDALIAAREQLVSAGEHDPVNEAMTSICGSHQDYIWKTIDQGGP